MTPTKEVPAATLGKDTTASTEYAAETPQRNTTTEKKAAEGGPTRIWIGPEDKEALRSMMPVVLRNHYGINGSLETNFRCLNPAHDDCDPSMHYYPDNFTVRCFGGCCRSWDVFDLVGMTDGIASFVDKALAVASIVGYPLSAAEPPVRVPRPAKPPFTVPETAGCIVDTEAVLEAYWELSTKPYPEVAEVRRVLHGRGLDDYILQHYAVGFTKDPASLTPGTEWPNLEPLVVHNGVMGFIVLPFSNGSGGFNYVTARPVPAVAHMKELKPKSTPSGQSVCTKAPIWQEHLLRARVPAVCVTEGIFDAMITEWRFGVPSVALCGTAWRRLASIMYYADPSERPETILLCLDNDEAGRQATAKIEKALDLIGIPHKDVSCYLGDAKDANEWHLLGRDTDWIWEEEYVAYGYPKLATMRMVNDDE